MDEERITHGVLNERIRNRLSDDEEELTGYDEWELKLRIQNAFIEDFGLLAEELQGDLWELREDIFAAIPDDEAEKNTAINPDILDGIADAIEFFFLGLARRGEDWTVEAGIHNIPAFETALKRGVKQASEKHGLPVDSVTLSIRSKQHDELGADELITLLKHMDPFPAHVGETVHDRGWVDEEDYREFLIEQVEKNADAD